MSQISIRRACVEDQPRLVEFNCAMARETEHLELIPETIAAGVKALLENPAYGFYLVAECEDELVGALMITTEWSDWRNGMFWWVQSVYVVPAHRRRGIYRRMYEFVRRLAEGEPHICGFRLYVERANTVAQATYKSLGMRESSYRLYEAVEERTPFTLP